MLGKASNWAVQGNWVPRSTWHCNSRMAAQKEALKDQAEAYTGYSVVKEAGNSQTHK